MECHDTDAVLIFGIENLRYLSGFTGSCGALFITLNDGYFLTDFRYKTQAEEEVSGYRIRCCRRLLDGIVELAAKSGLKTVGFEGRRLTYDNYVYLSERLPGKRFAPISSELERIRIVKDEDEVACIKKAIEIADKGFQIARESIAPGISEKEIACLIEAEVKRNGADSLSFDLIVASGERAALPHGRPSSKRFNSGEPVIVDIGVSYEGYNSDKTRTFFVDSATEKGTVVYQIAKEAQERAIGMIKPGVRAAVVDKEARDYIKRKGYGRYFGHATGHGVGIGIHEPPSISQCSKDVLEAGMVFTVEPGIYIPEWGGVRVEDMVLVTENGHEYLTGPDT